MIQTKNLIWQKYKNMNSKIITAEDVWKLWKWVSNETASSKMKGGKSLLTISAEHGHDFHNLDHFLNWLKGLEVEKLILLYDDIAYGGRRKYWKEM